MNAIYRYIKEHLCSQHQHYLDRSPDYYLQKTKAKSEIFHRLVQLLFEQNRYPEQLYRTCDGLLNLHRKTPADAFEKACQLAIEHQNYSYRFIQKILENNMQEQSPIQQDKPLPKHENVRGKQYYIQSSLKF